MTLARAWGGQAFRATAATLIAPVAILVALGVAAGGGGLGGLGSLGQIVTGPDAPADLAGTTGAETNLAGGETVVLAPPSAAPAGSGAATGARDVRELARTQSPGGGPIAGIEPPARPREAPPARRPDSGGGGGGGGNPPPRTPSTIEQLGDSTKGVTNELPGPLGPTVGELIDEVVRTCRQVQCP